MDTFDDRHGELLQAIFVISGIAAAWLEVFYARRSLATPRWRRWLPNLSFALINSLIGMLAAPVGALAAAILAVEQGWGVLHLVAMPDWLAIILGVLVLDAVWYGYHRLMHKVPLGWRLHRVHHSDVDIDFTTTFRHHPFEALLGFIVVFATTIIFGISVQSVVLHQGALLAIDVLSHSNIRLPRWLDESLRWVIVTPGMHVVHHSAVRRETDSNFAGALSIWDRLFGTYVEVPAERAATMTLGLEYWREREDQGLGRILLSPLTNPASRETPRAPVTAPAGK